ncbi:hypothetical protein FQN60_018521 [Etheostoma spectabile]|uniref:Uncharacterized protein n=1 Tax=Etheostoma spectabile TaxID=54343 RepID=A0A5J5DI65_9PERO|nr:hypothetical protein FQN60_018521 [Etheostoma spectabile]
MADGRHLRWGGEAEVERAVMERNPQMGGGRLCSWSGWAGGRASEKMELTTLCERAWPDDVISETPLSDWLEWLDWDSGVWTRAKPSHMSPSAPTNSSAADGAGEIDRPLMFPLRIEMDKTTSAVTHIGFLDNCVDLTNKM